MDPMGYDIANLRYPAKKKMKKIFAGEGRYSQPDTKRLKD